MSDHRKTILEVLAEQFLLADSELDANPTLADLGCDSLDFVEIVMQIEDEVGQDIDESKFPNRTLPDPRKENFRILNPEWNAFTVNDFIAEVERQMASEVPSNDK